MERCVKLEVEKLDETVPAKKSRIILSPRGSSLEVIHGMKNLTYRHANSQTNKVWTRVRNLVGPFSRGAATLEIAENLKESKGSISASFSALIKEGYLSVLPK
jgi:hypothetical protein